MRDRWRKLIEGILALAGIVSLALFGGVSGDDPPGSDPSQPPDPPQQASSGGGHQRRRVSARSVSWVLAAIAAVILITSGVISSLSVGPEQPVPFSHHVHATDKQINCFFCHPYAGVSAHAGIPPVEKCMLCHKVIASNFEPIRKLRGYYDRKEPIPWVRVASVPDHVHFSHECHIARRHDCGECHGNVREMDRIAPVRKFDMNFCITCHKGNKVSTSCFTCHY